MTDDRVIRALERISAKIDEQLVNTFPTEHHLVAWCILEVARELRAESEQGAAKVERCAHCGAAESDPRHRGPGKDHHFFVPPTEPRAAEREDAAPEAAYNPRLFRPTNLQEGSPCPRCGEVVRDVDRHWTPNGLGWECLMASPKAAPSPPSTNAASDGEVRKCADCFLPEFNPLHDKYWVHFDHPFEPPKPPEARAAGLPMTHECDECGEPCGGDDNDFCSQDCAEASLTRAEKVIREARNFPQRASGANWRPTSWPICK